MFKSLKEKLKGWFKKAEEPQDEELPEKTQQPPQEPNKEQEEKPKTPEEPAVEKPKTSLFTRKLDEKKFESLFEELELILLQNNTAFETVEKIKQGLKEKLFNQPLSKINLKEELKQTLESLFTEKDFLKDLKEKLSTKKPIVIVFFGINGCGKTTTIAKLAHLLKEQSLSVCLAAADTFRAASIEQLEQHAKNLEIPLIKKQYGSDPASVGFDAINFAKKRAIDIVLIDTAGRMQNQDSLMKEMKKIVKVTNPDYKIFISESITGNDAIEQSKAFDNEVGIDGIILSKADVDEKGGTALSISSITKKPIFFLGVGQEYKDLKPFNKEDLIENLLE